MKRKPSYHEPVYDKMWAAFEELNLPISVHSGADDEPLALETEIPLHAQVCDNKMFMMQRSLALLVTSAVPQRFSKLRFVIVEGGIGWIAAQLRFMDHWWEDHHRWMQPKLDEAPSFYFQRQFWATFEDDRPGILTRHLLSRRSPDVGFGLPSYRGNLSALDRTDSQGLRGCSRRRDARDGAR